MIRVLALLLTTTTLGGCALQPLYAGGGQGAIAQSLSSVEVAPIEGEAGWLVRTALTDRLQANGRNQSRLHGRRQRGNRACELVDRHIKLPELHQRGERGNGARQLVARDVKCAQSR